jgi:Protein of unknown function (DUF1524)
LFCSYTPKNWAGYEGFKDDSYIPLRNFSVRTAEATKTFIEQFADGLAKVSRHYAAIVSPTEAKVPSKDERTWLIKILRTGNTANFLPLIVAARIGRERGYVSEQHYVEMLQAIERFAYRVFLFAAKRSNAGKSSFHKWAWEVLHQEQKCSDVPTWIDGLTRYYADEKSFAAVTQAPSNWYGKRNLLRYTLFEYELHLLATEGQGKAPSLAWEQLSDSTIEHILPQTPDEGSHWLEKWDAEQIKSCLHDIGNLVLTQDNSSYRNFEFTRKKGKAGESPSYSNSDIRQERKISSFADWGPDELVVRRQELSEWILERWRTADKAPVPAEIDERDDVDAVPEALVALPPEPLE